MGAVEQKHRSSKHCIWLLDCFFLYLSVFEG